MRVTRVASGQPTLPSTRPRIPPPGGSRRAEATAEAAASVSMSRVSRASWAAMAAKLIATTALTAALSPVTVAITTFAPVLATVR